MISRKEYKLIDHDNNNPSGLCYWTIEGIQGIWYEGWSTRMFGHTILGMSPDLEEKALQDIVNTLNLGGGYFEKPVPAVDES